MFLPYNHRAIPNEISEQDEERMIATFSFQESTVLLGIFRIRYFPGIKIYILITSLTYLSWERIFPSAG